MPLGEKGVGSSMTERSSGKENRSRYRRGRAEVSWGKLCALLGGILLCGVLMTGCGRDGSGTKVIFTTGFGEDEVFRIADTGCSRAELMVYLTTAQSRYEKVYGTDVWSVEKDGITLEDNVKETVLAKLARIKTMCLLAEEKEVVLDGTEEELVAAAAAEYFSSLNETELSLLGVDEETIRKLYGEYALANKVYAYIIQDVNPEISDDEARTITVQRIFLRTWTTDGSGARIPYTEKVRETVREKALGIREQAMDGEQDFAELASKYSDEAETVCSFGKGELDSALEEVAFALETGEISPVLETEEGFYLLKCISTFDREQTELSKQEIVGQRKQEVFGEEYDAFALTLVRQLNTELWEEICLIHGEEVYTADFFELYEKYF